MEDGSYAVRTPHLEVLALQHVICMQTHPKVFVYYFFEQTRLTDCRPSNPNTGEDKV